MFNAFLDLLKEKGIGFTKIQIPTVGQTVVKSIVNALWYIDPHLGKFRSRRVEIPECFARFKNYNDWKQKKKKRANGKFLLNCFKLLKENIEFSTTHKRNY